MSFRYSYKCDRLLDAVCSIKMLPNGHLTQLSREEGRRLFTKAALARMWGTHPVQLTKFMNGDRPMPLEWAVEVCLILDECGFGMPLQKMVEVIYPKDRITTRKMVRDVLDKNRRIVCQTKNRKPRPPKRR